MRMATVDVYDPKTRLSELLDRALAGEEIVVARAGTPLVRLVPLDDRPARRPGIAAGRVTDAFDEPLPHGSCRWSGDEAAARG